MGPNFAIIETEIVRNGIGFSKAIVVQEIVDEHQLGTIRDNLKLALDYTNNRISDAKYTDFIVKTKQPLTPAEYVKKYAGKAYFHLVTLPNF